LPSHRRLLLEDIPRLLRGRDHFRALQTDAGASVPAFLAWKALLLAAQTGPPGSESSQCRDLLRTSYLDHPEYLREAIGSFQGELQTFRKRSINVIAEWFIIPEEGTRPSAEQITRQCRNIVKRIRALSGDLCSEQSFEARELDESMNFAYLMRNAIIAHGTVLSTGPLFRQIAPRFEDFVSSIALVRWAKLNRITPVEAEKIVVERNPL
jgi:hypothetical protein